MSQDALAALEERFGSAARLTMSAHGDETAVVEAGSILDICRFLHDDPRLGFTMLVDLTCVDTLGLDNRTAGRFEVVYHLRSMRTGKRLRLKTLLDEGTGGVPPEVASVTSIWKGANWPEREVWDLFGIRFRGHPDLRRILMYDEFVGHPLRKDYPKEKRQPLIRRDFT